MPYKTEIVSVKFPFSIAKLSSYKRKTNGPFTNQEKTVYNVECFSTVQYECKKLADKLCEEYPDHTYNIYARSATPVNLGDDKMVHRLKFLINIKKDNTIAVNLELLPADKKSDEAFTIDPLDETEKHTLLKLFQALIQDDDDNDVTAVTAATTTDDDVILTPCELERSSAIME